MTEYITNSYEETVALGENFAKRIDKGSVIGFIGGLGMGKTAFVTGLAKGLGIDSSVSSPTFSICNIYENKETTLCHFDMYRIGSWDDLYSTGFFDYLDGNKIIAVEWSENVYGALPNSSYIIEIERLGETSRKFKVQRKSEEIQ